MTVGHVLDEIKKIKECRENLQHYKDQIERERGDACKLFDDNITNILETIFNTIDILGNVELMFRTKIQDIEVNI